MIILKAANDLFLLEIHRIEQLFHERHWIKVPHRVQAKHRQREQCSCLRHVLVHGNFHERALRCTTECNGSLLASEGVVCCGCGPKVPRHLDEGQAKVLCIQAKLAITTGIGHIWIYRFHNDRYQLKNSIAAVPARKAKLHPDFIWPIRTVFGDALLHASDQHLRVRMPQASLLVALLTLVKGAAHGCQRSAHAKIAVITRHRSTVNVADDLFKTIWRQVGEQIFALLMAIALAAGRSRRVGAGTQGVGARSRSCPHFSRSSAKQ